jgi:hypothetical protein
MREEYLGHGEAGRVIADGAAKTAGVITPADST